ncbi:hypothetical protein GCK32_000513 [Trichostrongylus colubriformis]|uniref:Transporter n=1 Tax=Trichostrongylus colubriformis TaxID=6319 RepID=A0AAN8FBD9_TRICO
MDGSEWKAALRLQIEALARRNDLHRRCNRDSIRTRTADMDIRIVKLRELVASDAHHAAQFYLECVCHADETERILNRTSSRDKKRRKQKTYRDTLSTVSLPTVISVPTMSEAVETILPVSSVTNQNGPRWWENLSIHRKSDDYLSGANEVRHLWKTQTDMSLSCLGFIVGIGNMMRFPGRICEYGGIFFVPYIFCHIFIGFPMLYLYLCIGQYAGQTADIAFHRLTPITCGLGWAFVFAAIPVIIYHNIILTWSLQYLWYSVLSVVISEDLPWENRVMSSLLVPIQREVTVSRTHFCITEADASVDFGPLVNKTLTSAELFFHLDILSLTSYTELILTLPQRHIVLALAAAWLLVFAGVCRSTTWMAWATRITATIPYLMLFILLVRGLSLPGASVGLTFLFTSALGSISSLDMWSAAAQQVLFEIGLGTGALFSIAAYSRFRNNVYRDAALLITINVLTSLLVGMVLFSFLGLLSISSAKKILTLTKNDPFYMVFTVIPSMTKLMRWGPLWMSVLFATIVFTGVDAEFIWVEMLASSVMNLLESKNRRLNSRLIAAICCLGFLVEIPICTSGGFFLFQSMDNLIASLPAFILSFMVLVAICYLYGLNKFISDVSSMLRVPVRSNAKWAHLRLQEKLLELFGPCGAFVRLSWAVVCPSFLVVLMIAHAINYKLPRFFGCHVPIGSEYVAWTLVHAPICAVLVGAVIATMKIRRSGKTVSSLFDGSAWHQEYTTAQFVDSPPPTPSNKTTPRRENTYMYIDPASRGPTVRSNFQQSADSYGWRSGRLKEWQETLSIDQSTSQKSFATSLASQRTLNLFGSPPASNGFMISDTTTMSSMADRIIINKDEKPVVPPSPPPPVHEIRLETLPRKSAKSEPPLKICSASDSVVPTFPPAPRVSPSRSEPPGVITDRPSTSIRHKNDFSDELSDSDEENGVRRQRTTVIRRYRSEDSVQAPSTGSISFMPIDIARQRSLSSVAIYDDKEKGSRPTQTLSQLKRPAPIETPTRF